MLCFVLLQVVLLLLLPLMLLLLLGIRQQAEKRNLRVGSAHLAMKVAAVSVSSRC